MLGRNALKKKNLLFNYGYRNSVHYYFRKPSLVKSANKLSIRSWDMRLQIIGVFLMSFWAWYLMNFRRLLILLQRFLLQVEFSWTRDNAITFQWQKIFLFITFSPDFKSKCCRVKPDWNFCKEIRNTFLIAMLNGSPFLPSKGKGNICTLDPRIQWRRYRVVDQGIRLISSVFQNMKL